MRNDLNNSQPAAVDSADLPSHFKRLAEQWRSESQFMSSMSDMVLLPAYQQIVGLGQDAVALLLRELDREPDYWFWALQAITGADPVQPADRGNLKKMAAAWIHWGKRQGYHW